MTRYLLLGGAVLAAVLLVGCTSEDDDVMRKYIGIKNEMAEIWGEVTDEPSFVAAHKKVLELNKQVDALEVKLNAWSSDRQEAMRRKYGQELEASQTRFEEKRKAAFVKTNRPYPPQKAPRSP